MKSLWQSKTYLKNAASLLDCVNRGGLDLSKEVLWVSVGQWATKLWSFKLSDLLREYSSNPTIAQQQIGYRACIQTQFALSWDNSAGSTGSWNSAHCSEIKNKVHCKYSELIYRQTKAFICCFKIKMTTLRIFEKCYNHRQLFVKIANDYHIQNKNWENLEIMKNIFQNHRQIFVLLTQSNYFSVNSATEIT